MLLNGKTPVDWGYRCYCEKLHEYQCFSWFDGVNDQQPFIVKSCGRFQQYEEDAPATTTQAHTPSKTTDKQPEKGLRRG